MIVRTQRKETNVKADSLLVVAKLLLTGELFSKLEDECDVHLLDFWLTKV